MNVSIYRMLKDTNMDNTMLEREIKRMQEIDRIKVSHAKDVFYNPDTGSVLPSLDTCHASTQEDLPSFLSRVGSVRDGGSSVTPQPNLLGSATVRDYVSFISQKDIVTHKELKGVCERAHKQPS